MKNINDKSISHAVLNLAEEYHAQERKTRYYGTDVPIYYAEIHALMVIAQQPGIHVVGLAQRLEVNKASASELVIKLEKKGLVEKCVGEDKRSKLAIYPTEKGVTAHQNHLKYHETFDQLIESQLVGLLPETQAVLLGFLRGITKRLQEFNIVEQAKKDKEINKK